MKIAINIQLLLHGNKSGIAYYQHEMMKALMQQNISDEYYLNYFDITGKYRSKADTYAGDKVSFHVCKWFGARLYQLLWAFIPIPYTLFFKTYPDVSVFFNYYLPPCARGKKILVIYDTVIKDHPETMSFKTRTMLDLTLKKSIKRADRIVTISEFSKKQIIKHYGVDENNITVVSCAADREKFYPINNKEDAVAEVCKKYNIDRDYYLYLGNLEPRKNIISLIKAYAMASDKDSDIPKLVLAGGKAWSYEKIFDTVKQLQLEDKVIFTGYVDDEDKVVLMNGAKAFCFPSLYEGFGMPPLEAMSCGTPVIVSNTTSLPEVVGDCGISVDPTDLNQISEALIKILDPVFANEQYSKGIERADSFSWTKSADKLRKLMEDVLDE